MRGTRPHIKLCHVQRNSTASTQPLDRTYMRALKSSIRQEMTKHFAEFFLEVESNFERVNLDSSTAVLRQLLLSFVHTAAQTARNIELLAGASSIGTRWSSVSFSQRQKAFWRRENCFHEAQARSLTRQMPRPKPPTANQRRTCWSHWQTTTAAPARTRPLVSRNQRHQRLPLLQMDQP